MAWSSYAAQITALKKTRNYSNGLTGTMVVRLSGASADAYCLANATTPYPGETALRPQQFDMTPVDGTVIAASGIADIVEISISFALDYLDVTWPEEMIRPNYKSGTTLKLKTKFSGQFLTLPAKAVKPFQSPGDPPGPPTPPNANNRILIPLMEHQIEWDRVLPADMTMNYFRGLMGCVNDKTFLGADAETLLFEGADLDNSFVIASNPRTFKLVVTLKERHINSGGTIYGWNYDYHPNPPGWKRITMADGTDRYTKTDFSEMFT